jgi:restriction endonuclease S subunit
MTKENHIEQNFIAKLQELNHVNLGDAEFARLLSIPSLSKKTIEKIKTYIPKPKEQQKIANFLSSIDELITSSTKKVETLKEHKKAFMQQLFPSKEVEQ